MARQFSKLAHSLYECKYHIVFTAITNTQILEGQLYQIKTYI